MKLPRWKSRLPGPFFVSFVLCFALIDYIMYAETQDSPLGWFWKFLALLQYILINLPYSEYVSAMGLFLAGSVVLLLVIVWFSKDSATRAMQAATETTVLDTEQTSARSGRTMTGGQISTAEFRNE